MRNRAYYRKMRAKHIRRKKAVCHNKYYIDSYYPHDGMYSKGKIHCSCMLCSEKTRNNKPSRRNHYGPTINYKHSDLKKICRMKGEIQDYS